MTKNRNLTRNEKIGKVVSNHPTIFSNKWKMEITFVESRDEIQYTMTTNKGMFIYYVSS